MAELWRTGGVQPADHLLPGPKYRCLACVRQEGIGSGAGAPLPWGIFLCRVDTGEGKDSRGSVTAGSNNKCNRRVLQLHLWQGARAVALRMTLRAERELVADLGQQAFPVFLVAAPGFFE